MGFGYRFLRESIKETHMGISVVIPSGNLTYSFVESGLFTDHGSDMARVHMLNDTPDIIEHSRLQTLRKVTDWGDDLNIIVSGRVFSQSNPTFKSGTITGILVDCAMLYSPYTCLFCIRLHEKRGKSPPNGLDSNG